MPPFPSTSMAVRLSGIHTHSFRAESLALLLFGCAHAPSPSLDGAPSSSTASGPQEEVSIPAPLPTIAPAPFEPPSIDLSARVETARRAAGVPALGIGLVQDETLVVWGVAGVRAAGEESPATLTDQWHIGSNTKAMTAHLTALLVAEGTVRWDTTVAEVYAELNPAEGWDQITLLDLCQQRTGLRGPQGLTLAFMRDSSDTPKTLRRQWVERTILPNSPPNDQSFAYANANFMLAGAILEERTGEAWESLLHQKLFAPLGMAGAGFGPPGADQPQGHMQTADGEWSPVPLGPLADNPMALGPAGTVHADHPSLTRYLAAQLDIAQGQEEPYTHPAFGALHTPPEGEAYTGGWFLLPSDEMNSNLEGRGFWHNGSNGMWLSNLYLLPEMDLAFICTSNAFERKRLPSHCESLLEQAIHALSDEEN